MTKKGLFITFEGPEGSGKTSQIKKLGAYLESLGKQVVLTKEPGGTKLGEKLREILKFADYDINPIAELLLFNASRSQICSELIKPSVDAGKIVICDRFYHSSIAYQGIARGIGKKLTEDICKIAINGLEPDIVFYLDISCENAFKRKGGAETNERIEMAGIEFHKKVENAYKLLLDEGKSNIIKIDASGDIEQVFNLIKTQIDKFL